MNTYANLFFFLSKWAKKHEMIIGSTQSYTLAHPNTCTCMHAEAHALMHADTHKPQEQIEHTHTHTESEKERRGLIPPAQDKNMLKLRSYVGHPS